MNIIYSIIMLALVGLALTARGYDDIKDIAKRSPSSNLILSRPTLQVTFFLINDAFRIYLDFIKNIGNSKACTD
jgi:hypothetical protein